MTDDAFTLDTPPPMPGCTICAHGWELTPEGDSTYVDADDAGPDAVRGCAYLRTPDGGWTGPNGEPFDIPNECDFETATAAIEFAQQYAERHGVRLFVY